MTDIKKYSESWIGKEFTTNEGYMAKVIGIGSKSNYCTIQINDWISEVLCCHLKTGKIKYPYHQSVYGMGYYGEGKYVAKKNGKMMRSYKTWNSMIERCYNPKRRNKNLSYVDCIIDPIWLNFQTFAKWYYENYKEIKGVKFQLDKDLMVEGNRIYSPQTCKFIPHYVNTFLANKYKTNNTGYTGVIWRKRDEIYESRINDVNMNKNIYLGRFKDPLEASEAYIEARKIQCINVYNKMVKDGITDQEILNKFKGGNL